MSKRALLGPAARDTKRYFHVHATATTSRGASVKTTAIGLRRPQAVATVGRMPNLAVPPVALPPGRARASSAGGVLLGRVVVAGQVAHHAGVHQRREDLPLQAAHLESVSDLEGSRGGLYTNWRGLEGAVRDWEGSLVMRPS
eukprot:1193653-Prorocentrum_minimum.AAC.5